MIPEPVINSWEGKKTIKFRQYSSSRVYGQSYDYDRAIEYFQSTVPRKQIKQKGTVTLTLKLWTNKRKSNGTDAGGIIEKIEDADSSRVKVVVKTVVGQTDYMLRYKIGNAKKWLNKSYPYIYILKGKKIKVQARIKDSNGWGKWGKTKTFVAGSGS